MSTELEALERGFITIPADKWEVFEVWANRPPQRIAALEELAECELAWSAAR